MHKEFGRPREPGPFVASSPTSVALVYWAKAPVTLTTQGEFVCASTEGSVKVSRLEARLEAGLVGEVSI